MTTPEIAGLCERLRYRLDLESDNPYVVSARTAEVVLTRIVPQDDLVEIADTLERQAAEVERLWGALGDATCSLASISGLSQSATKAAVKGLQNRSTLKGEDA